MRAKTSAIAKRIRGNAGTDPKVQPKVSGLLTLVGSGSRVLPSLERALVRSEGSTPPCNFGSPISAAD
jgi:hypothetical protein